MIVISPYADTLLLKNSRLVRVCDKTIIAVGNKFLYPSCVDTFITHNPYDEFLIHDWDRIHCAEGFDIGIGVYGNSYDEDKSDKIKMLSRIYGKLKFGSSGSSVIDFELDTDRDKYFGLVSAKSKQMIKGPLVKSK